MPQGGDSFGVLGVRGGEGDFGAFPLLFCFFWDVFACSGVGRALGILR